jgi:hypothetical protein
VRCFFLITYSHEWIKDESLEDDENLPSPEIIAAVDESCCKLMLVEVVEDCIMPESLKRAGFVETVELICCLKAELRNLLRKAAELSSFLFN